MKAYPLKFRPIYKQRIWGGRKLREVFGRDIPPGEEIGESWELADLPEDKSVLTNGEFAGQTLGSLIQQYPKEITARADFPLPFPLLIKFLDAEDVLSVQVHPDPQTCRRLGKGQPKTECWYIILAEPGAVIYKGLKETVTRERFTQAIENGSVAELLAEVPVAAGQCHLLPAGTVHSIGAGLVIAEIQTPSDTTYRVFDFNRVDQNGKPRQLHIQEALESIHFEAGPDDLPVTTAGRLVDCEYFAVDKGHQPRNGRLPVSSGQMKTVIFLSGFGSFEDAQEEVVEFKAGETILVPAQYEGRMKFGDDTEYLTVTV
jgi:mannose-6-phosphate isomerase